MSRWSRSDYERFAALVASSDSNWRTIEAMTRMFKTDNDRFNPGLFQRRIGDLREEAGLPRRATGSPDKEE